MADENTLLNSQLAKKVLQIAGHGLIGQYRAVRAVAMVTGIDSQHLTGQRTIKTLGIGKEGKRERILLHKDMGARSKVLLAAQT